MTQDASYEEVQEARNYLVEQYAGHDPSREAIELALDDILQVCGWWVVWWWMGGCGGEAVAVVMLEGSQVGGSLQQHTGLMLRAPGGAVVSRAFV